MNDLKDDFIKSIPTTPAKRLLLVMLASVPLSWWGPHELNPLWPELDSKKLVLAKIGLSVFLVSAFSVGLNFYYAFKLKELHKYMSKKLPVVIQSSIKEALDKEKKS